MRKSMISGVVAVFVAVSAVIACAQEPEKTDKPVTGKRMMGKEMMGRGMKDMSAQCGMMMGNGGMVATSDGGVIVKVGNMLYKYDKNLNLVKEAEIKIDMEGMRKQMMGMKEKRPMCQEMKECEGMMGQGEEEKEEPELEKSTKK